MVINKMMRIFNNSETLGIRDVQIKFMWNENTLFIEYLLYRFTLITEMLTLKKSNRFANSLRPYNLHQLIDRFHAILFLLRWDILSLTHWNR